MKHRIMTFIIGSILILPITAGAQLNPAKSHVGFGAGVVLPLGDFGDAYDMGYEFHAKNTSHLGENIAIGAHLGMQFLPGNTIELVGQDDQVNDDELQTIFSIGPEWRQDNWFLGVHIGYNLSDNLDSEVILLPTAGFMLGGLQIDGRVQLLGDHTWFGAGLTYYFLEW